MKTVRKLAGGNPPSRGAYDVGWVQGVLGILVYLVGLLLYDIQKYTGTSPIYRALLL